jgi:hypothetical protein
MPEELDEDPAKKEEKKEGKGAKNSNQLIEESLIEVNEENIH